MSFGDGNLRERVAQLEKERRDLEADWVAARAENARLRERAAMLESLVRGMYSYAVNREMELCNVCTDANGDYADCAACDEYDGACGVAKKRFEVLYADHMAALGLLEGGKS